MFKTMLKAAIEKLWRGLSFSQSKSPNLNRVGFDAKRVVPVPQDVKEGHFVVFAVIAGAMPKRFVVAMGHLTNPAFLKLLKQAEEEYGFYQRGALLVPCRPEELQMILQDKP